MSGPRLPVPRQRGGGVVIALFVLLITGLVSTVVIQLVRQQRADAAGDTQDIGRVEMDALERKVERDRRAVEALIIDTVDQRKDWRSPIPRITAADTLDLDSLGITH